jgi:hypothetical protein
MTLRRLKGRAVSVRALTTYGGLEAQLHSFLTSALADSEVSFKPRPLYREKQTAGSN